MLSGPAVPSVSLSVARSLFNSLSEPGNGQVGRAVAGRRPVADSTPLLSPSFTVNVSPLAAPSPPRPRRRSSSPRRHRLRPRHRDHRRRRRHRNRLRRGDVAKAVAALHRDVSAPAVPLVSFRVARSVFNVASDSGKGQVCRCWRPSPPVAVSNPLLSFSSTEKVSLHWRRFPSRRGGDRRGLIDPDRLRGRRRNHRRRRSPSPQCLECRYCRSCRSRSPRCCRPGRAVGVLERARSLFNSLSETLLMNRSVVAVDCYRGRRPGRRQQPVAVLQLHREGLAAHGGADFRYAHNGDRRRLTDTDGLRVGAVITGAPFAVTSMILAWRHCQSCRSRSPQSCRPPSLPCRRCPSACRGRYSTAQRAAMVRSVVPAVPVSPSPAPQVVAVSYPLLSFSATVKVSLHGRRFPSRALRRSL